MSLQCTSEQPIREAEGTMSSRVTGQTPPSLADASDDALLYAIGQPDHRAAQQAGAELVNRHLSYIVHICRLKLGNQAEAEEAAQDVFLSVWKNAGNWQSGNAKVTTWLYRIAANRCIDILRRRKPTTDIEAIAEPADERENIEAAHMEADRNRQLRAALGALTADQKQAIELVYYGETKQADAAAQMGITLAALESLLRRARSKLSDELTPLKDHLEPIS
ncbi:sigma-70 family RNA polymerase sigma factor [Alphaproteobacteria bacterium]|nr:RNA polymerase sigma-70 factor [Rhodobiaceae bacterium]MDA8544816.1 sigma-70 family RNA polymerase sigma factor [Alphaproteobacteria bacterium]RPF93975.1 MAG: sigma-70 family RNA polymerase sigma factor [Rhizobiales bacterium TMED162]MDA8625504.1 sigma-70 family RNA polymerase sigma factor [Alphaproteobacteria bacterium]MDA8642590.1 sigma-70 family RNA polymerase sigma factor [Alphaproteobacteria bacterium]